MKAAALLAILALAACAAHAQALNPAVTQGNIRTTICAHGWTDTVRPPVSYTNGIKRDLMRGQSIPWARRARYELDHIIPLELGGAPRDPRNLQLQPWDGPDGAHRKDAVETRTKRLVCAGRMKLETARECMARDWRECPAS